MPVMVAVMALRISVRINSSQVYWTASFGAGVTWMVCLRVIEIGGICREGILSLMSCMVKWY